MRGQCWGLTSRELLTRTEQSLPLEKIMAAEVKLRAAEIELRTCKLTKAILKQIKTVSDWNTLQSLIPTDLRSPAEEQRMKAVQGIIDDHPPGCQVSEAAEKELLSLKSKPSFTEWMQQNVVGWLHGSLRGDEYARDLLVKVGDGDYVLYCCAHMETVNKFKQIFVL